jgi:molybdopterin-binding protein
LSLPAPGRADQAVFGIAAAEVEANLPPRRQLSATVFSPNAGSGWRRRSECDRPARDRQRRPRSPKPDEDSMKLSARNQIKGKIIEVTKGQTTAHVRIDIGGGVIVTSSITNEAVDDLGLRVGDEAYAVIKASDVMVAK